MCARASRDETLRRGRGSRSLVFAWACDSNRLPPPERGGRGRGGCCLISRGQPTSSGQPPVADPCPAARRQGKAVTRHGATSKKILRHLRRPAWAGQSVCRPASDGLIDRELLRSGATREEERRPLSGDEVVSPPCGRHQGRTIHAPAAAVWPWLAHMGYGRGGWYCGNPLEREDTGASRLLADFHRLGWALLARWPRLRREQRSLDGRMVEAPFTLVFHSMRDPITGAQLDPADNPRLFIDTAWAFQLEAARPPQDAAPRWDADQDELSLGHPSPTVDGRRRHRYAVQAPRRDEGSSRDNHKKDPRDKSGREDVSLTV